MNRQSLFFIACACCVLFSCNKKQHVSRTVLVKNDLGFDRDEIVSINIAEFGDSLRRSRWIVKSGDDVVVSQLVDLDLDSLTDELIFQASLKADEEKKYSIEVSEVEEVKAEAKSDGGTFSRFVPERIDDYAWENDLVAFRTYGPEAQRLVEAGEPGGTLSSGMDCWLKRVNYPVINKWYAKHVKGGSYHKDDEGEGYDPYHVGKSRGCGGVGVWKNDSLYISKNFVSYKKIAEGPLRNIFELIYAPWVADGHTINETKRITIDQGNQLYKVEDVIYPTSLIPNLTIGISLHDKKGATHADSSKGVFAYWEPIDDSEIGTAVVIDPASILAYSDYRTAKKDLSHLYVHAKPDNVVYYTGFAWSKAGVIKDVEGWKQHLERFAQRLKSPLIVNWTWD